MRSGTLNSYVTIERSFPTRDAETNEATKEWLTWRSALADINPMSGKERFAAGARHSETTHTFRFHYYDVEGLQQTDRLVFETSYFDITGILPDRTHRVETMVYAREVAPGET